MDGSINTQNYLINEWGKNPSQNYLRDTDRKIVYEN